MVRLAVLGALETILGMLWKESQSTNKTAYILKQALL
jgi:hypothetical protein